MPELPPSEILLQLSPEQLVAIILKQQEQIQRLMDEVERLKRLLKTDSETSSKPPSRDLHKRSEQPAKR